MLNLILIIGFYLLVSGLRPFYCPVELRFCVRSYSDISVRFSPIFAIYVKKLIKNEISNMKSIRKEIISNLAKNLYDSKDKTLMREAVYILSKNIVIFKNNFQNEHEKIIKILSGLPLFYIVIKTISFSKYS